jgi:EAL domain-containing protein (putative c-di-GMP-specific phosphodiesterase class I)
MAHKLGIKVIAEGIETATTGRFDGRRMRFRAGIPVSKPISGEELEKQLQKQCPPVYK